MKVLYDAAHEVKGTHPSDLTEKIGFPLKSKSALGWFSLRNAAFIVWEAKKPVIV